MKLYSAKLTLFGRKVEIALHEKGIAFERIQVPFSQTEGYAPRDPFVQAVNPRGQIPVLVDGDLTLFDSTVILEYLEDAYPTPPLYPRGAADRARCRLLDLWGDELLLPPLRSLMHRNVPGPRDPTAWAAAEHEAAQAEATIRSQYADLETKLGPGPYFLGAFSAADIALCLPILYSQRLGGPGLSPLPGLAAWYRRMRARPAVAGILSEILDADRELSAPVASAHPDSEP